MLDEINSRGLEVFAGLLLILGEANLISITLNKQQGFFTLNIGSDLFDWREPQAVPISRPPMQTPVVPIVTSVDPTKPYSTLDKFLITQNGKVDMTDSNNLIILFGIFVTTVFLLENPFIDTSHLTNT